jgi:hypothetical protein
MDGFSQGEALRRFYLFDAIYACGFLAVVVLPHPTHGEKSSRM